MNGVSSRSKRPKLTEEAAAEPMIIEGKLISSAVCVVCIVCVGHVCVCACARVCNPLVVCMLGTTPSVGRACHTALRACGLMAVSLA